MTSSSLGGPLLWPRDEPGPTCIGPHEDTSGELVPSGPVGLVPVLQLFATEFPELPFPDGTDLLQVMWCPFEHLKHTDYVYLTRPQLFWRNKLVCDGELAMAAPVGADYLPQLCVLHPERCVDYPIFYDLPDDISDLVEERFDEIGLDRCDYDDLLVVSGAKVGGYPTWTQKPDWPHCEQCGEQMDHLLTVNSEEPHGMEFGDGGGIYIFVCTRCPDRPFDSRVDWH